MLVKPSRNQLCTPSTLKYLLLPRFITSRYPLTRQKTVGRSAGYIAKFRQLDGGPNFVGSETQAWPLLQDVSFGLRSVS